MYRLFCLKEHNCHMFSNLVLYIYIYIYIGILLISYNTCRTATDRPPTRHTGWDDGYIRAYSPQTGTMMYSVKDAHSSRGVTAIAAYFDCSHFVSGGVNGQVRIWTIDPATPARRTPSLKMTLKEHTASITAIKMRKDDKACLTSSDDGSCIMWNLEFVCDPLLLLLF